MNSKRCPGCMHITFSADVCEHCGYDLLSENASHQLPTGTVLNGHYLVGKVLGQGGFGITYLGWDLKLNIPIAIKEYYPTGMVMRESNHSLDVINCSKADDRGFQQNLSRFVREAQALARLRNVNEVVHVHNYFHENSTAYIIMEYIDGITLKSYVLSREKLEPAETFSLLLPVMQALQSVHSVDLIHRDISPDNIMILPGGGVKLLDFGAVREVPDADVDRNLDTSTESILKHGYAPMEQYQRRGNLGPWTDIYALCATIFFCLTGTVPADAPARMMDDIHPDWHSVSGLTDAEIAALEKGMAMLARDRFYSAGELIEALFSGKSFVPSSNAHPMSGISDRCVISEQRSFRSYDPITANPKSEWRHFSAAIPTKETFSVPVIPDTPVNSIPSFVSEPEPGDETIYEADIPGGEDTILDDETVDTLDETVLSGSRNTALLLQPGEEKVFLINRKLTKIGRSSKSDIVLENNSSISKIHAELRLENNQYCLTDCHSSNGTYYQGEALEPGKQIPLDNPALFQLNEELMILICGTVLKKILDTGFAAFVINENRSALRVMESDSFPLNRNSKWPDGTLSDSKVHRSAHARIIRKGNGFYLVDEGPERGNGTHLNGSRMNHGETRQLHSGDKIRVGGTILEFVCMRI